MSASSERSSSPVSPSEDAIHYDEFFGPLYFEPSAVEVAKRIDPAATLVLEIAAGTGRVTRHIRERISPAAKLIASNISDDMLAVAKKKWGHLDIDWQIIDAQQLTFSDNCIDLVVCCFAYMFVPDKPKAMAEAYRVLKPGGHFLFTTWDKLENNPASYVSSCMAKQYFDDSPAASDNQATSMSEEHILRALLHDAGFSRMSVEKLTLQSSIPDAKTAAYGFIQGNAVYDEIRKRRPESMGEIETQLEEEFAGRFGDRPMIVPLSALVAEAWKEKL